MSFSLHYSLDFFFSFKELQSLFWTYFLDMQRCGVTRLCIFTENIFACPHRTIAILMCGKTYYRCHHLFNKQFGSWFMQWIANGTAASKFKSPVCFMAALLEPQLIGRARILYKRGILSCWEWVTQVDLITSEVFWQVRAWSHNSPCSS